MKMRGLHNKSLRVYTTFLLVALALFFATLVAYNNHKAFSMLLNRVYINTQDTVILYQKQLDSELSRVETYLYTIVTSDADLVTLKYADTHTTKFHNSMYRLEKNLKNALPLYCINGFFCYLPENNYFISANNSNQSYTSMREAILSTLIEDASLYKTWSLLEFDGNYYFLRIVKNDYSYVGAWVKAETLLDSIAQNEKLQLFFSTLDGSLFPYSGKNIILDFPETDTSGYIIENVEGEKKFIVFQQLESGVFYLVRMIPYSEVSDDNQSMNNVILIVSVCFLLIWLLLLAFLRMWILKPISAMTQELERLRSGDFDAYVVASHQLDEFQKMSHAFNDMVSEIKTLKIDVYERRIQHQRLEMQYLKQQITPHFMINCLNTAYQLIEIDHADLSRKMLMNLSRYLRYTLSSGQTVALEEELDLVENYIEISCIRYPQSISLIMNCDRGLQRATVIPLLILNFVENAIKHEVFLGKLLEIHVEIVSYQKKVDSIEYSENTQFLHVCIWDNGRGFSREVLEKLQKMEGDEQEDSSHIGIMNVLYRANQVFQTCEFKFSNREEAGAQIDIDLPFILFD